LPVSAFQWLKLLPLQEKNSAVRQMIWEIDGLVAVIAQCYRNRVTRPIQ